MRERNSNFCMKLDTRIKFLVATKTILSSRLRCESDYFGHCTHTYYRLRNKQTHTQRRHTTHIRIPTFTHVPTYTQGLIHVGLCAYVCSILLSALVLGSTRRHWYTLLIKLRSIHAAQNLA